jgi:hypothetical protein
MKHVLLFESVTTKGSRYDFFEEIKNALESMRHPSFSLRSISSLSYLSIYIDGSHSRNMTVL